MEDFPFFQQNGEQFSVGSSLFHEEVLDLFATDSTPGFFDDRENFQTLLNWPDQSDPIENSFDLDFKFDLKPGVQQLESPILTNALTSPVPIKLEPVVRKVPSGRCGDKIVFPGDVEPLQVSNSIQTDNVLKRITQARSVLINGEKEIFGKNIIGLHCLNEIKTSQTDQNCQLTSTVINGKKYNIIIKQKASGAARSAMPASQRSNLCSETPDIKVEPTDELISELQNGDYDVLSHEEVLDPWTLPLPNDSEEVVDDLGVEMSPQSPPPPQPLRVPPLRIKIPKINKIKKHKKKQLKADSISELLRNYEEETEKRPSSSKVEHCLLVGGGGRDRSRQRPERPEAVLSPSSSSADDSSLQSETIPSDHDYCSYARRQPSSNQEANDSLLLEKNPRKDSGLESGGVSDVSDASEESPLSSSPDSPLGVVLNQSAPVLAKELTSKLIEERRRTKNYSHVTKMAAALFRAANAATSGHKVVWGSNETPTTPSQTENGNAASDSVTESLAQNCDIDPSVQLDNFVSAPSTNERPKKKLKLEEYLNRRVDKDNDGLVSSFAIMAHPTHQTVQVKEEVMSVNDANGSILPDDQMLEEGEVPADTVPSELIVMEDSNTPKAVADAKCLTDVSDSHAKQDKTGSSRSGRRSTSKSTKRRESAERMGSQSTCQRKKRRRSSDDVGRCPPRRQSASFVHRPAARFSRFSSSSSADDRRYKRRASRTRSGRSVSRERRQKYRSRSSSRDSSSSSGGCVSSRRRSFLNSPSRYRRRTRTRTRSRSPYGSRSRDNSRSHDRAIRRRPQTFRDRQSTIVRSRSPVYSQREKQRQIEERRVVYVGRIAEGTTNHQLRQRFNIFGPIIDISVHFREHGDNYGFVTYAYKDDAYQAVEHGNDNSSLPKYDLSFGGRRSFCKQRYADLDGMPTSYSAFNDSPVVRPHDDSFDLLLKQAKAKLHMRKDAT